MEQNNTPVIQQDVNELIRVRHEKLAELYKKVGKIVYVEDEENPGIILP